MLRFVFSSSNTLGNIPTKNNLRSAFARTALAQVSHQSHNVCTANRGSGEKNGAQMRTKVSFGRTMMQALELRTAVGE